MNKALQKLVGKRLQSLRNEKLWTQEQLAEKSRLSKIHIAFIETGVRSISLEALAKICSVLRISLEDFFSGVEFKG